MDMRSSGWLVLLTCSTARADDELPELGMRTPVRWEQQHEPVLHLDPIPPPATEGLGGETDRATSVIELGPRARLVGEGERWKSSLTPQAFGPEIDDLSRGWRASYELSYDLGLFRVGASIGAGHVDSRFERGTYRVVSLAAYRTFRLSRWMLAWISLGIGHQDWFGNPPPGEANATTATLSIGTTFR